MRKQPVSKGFGAGLQIWLLFLLSLYWIDYPALFSIAIGAIGGSASGFIIDWWLSKEENTKVARRSAHEDGATEEVALSRRRQRRNSALRYRQRKREPRQTLDWRKVFRRDDPS